MTMEMLVRTVVFVCILRHATISGNLDTNHTIHIGVLADCSGTSDICEKRSVTETAYIDNATLTMNLIWNYVVMSEIYDVTQTIEKSKADVDFYIIAAAPSEMLLSSILPVLDYHDIRYLLLCILQVVDTYKTMCLPQIGDRDVLTFWKESVSEEHWHTAEGKCILRNDQLSNRENISSAEIQGQDSSHASVMATGCDVHDIYAVDVDINSDVSRMVTAVMANEKWNNVLVLHESMYDQDIGALLDGFSKLSLIVRSVYAIDDMSIEGFYAIFRNVSDLGKATPVRVLVMCSETCSNVLKAVNSYDTKRRGATAWYYFAEIMLVSMTTLDQFEDELFSSGVNNIALVRLPACLSYDYSEGRQRSSESGSDRYNSEVAKLTRQVAMELETNNCSMSNDTSTTLPSAILEQMKKYQESRADLLFPVSTLVWTGKGRGLQHVGSVHVSGDLEQTSSLFPNKKFGFNGRQFLISSIEYYPFVEKFGDNMFDGFCFDILRQLAKDMNFTYTLTTSPDLEWGVVDGLGRWSGLIGQLQRREVDMVVTALTVLSYRETVMDFTHPFFYDATIFLMTKEDPNSKKWKTILEPFHWTTLAVIGGCLALVSVCACALDKISPARKENEERHWKYPEALLYLYAALIGQGGGKLPETQIGRLMVGSWWIVCVVLMATYTGNLVAFLTVSKDLLPFNSVEEMVQQDVYKWGVIGGTSWVLMFQMSTLPTFQAVYTGMVRFNKTDHSVLSMDEEVHLEKVLRGNYVYIGDKSQIQVKMINECSLFTGSAEIHPVHYSFGLPNQSPFTELFSHKIMEMQENGLISNWKRKRWPQKNFCPESLQTQAKVISLADVQSAFYLLVVGIVLAFISYLCELVMKKGRSRRQDNSIAVN